MNPKTDSNELGVIVDRICGFVGAILHVFEVFQEFHLKFTKARTEKEKKAFFFKKNRNHNALLLLRFRTGHIARASIICARVLRACKAYFLAAPNPHCGAQDDLASLRPFVQCWNHAGTRYRRRVVQ